MDSPHKHVAWQYPNAVLVSAILCSHSHVCFPSYLLKKECIHFISSVQSFYLNKTQHRVLFAEIYEVRIHTIKGVAVCLISIISLLCLLWNRKEIYELIRRKNTICTSKKLLLLANGNTSVVKQPYCDTWSPKNTL